MGLLIKLTNRKVFLISSLMSIRQLKVKVVSDKQLAASAIKVALGTFTSRILGYLRDMLILHYFSRTATDAFFVAFRLPNLFRRIFGEGALTVSFIPVLTDFLKSDDHKKARDLTSAIFTLLFVVLGVITLIGTFAADPIIDLITGKGFSSVGGKAELTISQTRIVFPYILLVSLYAFFMGVLNTHKVFFCRPWRPLFGMPR